jgi:hypothetical protein
MSARTVSRITLLSLLLTATTVRAEDSRSGVHSFGLRAAYGNGDRSGLKFVSLLPRLSLFLPALVDRPLSHWGLEAEFVVEPIISYITNSTDTVEVGINPLIFSLRYDRGQVLVPFLEGGEGILYTDLRGERLGTRFQFSSQAGGGIHWFLQRDTALTLSYRIRHISNAGISEENRGLNTHFFTLGVSFFPKR